jgi:ABC-type microcin C transport system duplicated ATPase subunit YejF
MTSLNPVMAVAEQIVETFEAHKLLSKPERYARGRRAVDRGRLAGAGAAGARLPA